MATPVWNEKRRRWELRIQEDYVVRTYTSTKPGIAGNKAVRKKARDAEDGKKGNEYIANAWPRFLSDIEKRTGKGEHWTRHEKYGRLYILPEVGKRKLSMMTQTAWQALINDAKPTARTKKDGTPRSGPAALSHKTLSNLREVIMAFCRFCYDDRLIEAIPSRLYVPKSAEKVGKDILSIPQINALFGVTAKPGMYWYANAWKVMLLHGFRPGEVYGLKRSDISNGVLSIKRSISASNEITPGKNKNARRRARVGKSLMRILNDQQIMLNRAGVESEWIFPTREGNQPIPKTSYEEFQRFAEEIGFRGSPYCLRHTHTSYMKGELPEHLLKAGLGHSDKMDTLGTYGHEIEGDLEKTADALDKFFLGFLG